MNELRKDNLLRIQLKNDITIDGCVIDYEKDRVLVKVYDFSLDAAQKLNELDDIKVSVYTHLGFKVMYSCVISALNGNHCIIIENTDSVPVVQKREYVRVLSNLKFEISKLGNVYNCTCKNISACGIAFCADEGTFSPKDTVSVKFSADEFGKDIFAEACIVNANKNNYSAKYTDINSHDVDRIVKYVFKLISDK